jgi:hypothetical protein
MLGETAGLSAGVDLAPSMIEEDIGSDVAAWDVARIVSRVIHHRPCGWSVAALGVARPRRQVGSHSERAGVCQVEFARPDLGRAGGGRDAFKPALIQWGLSS